MGSTAQPIKGLPEGVELVRLGTAGDEDYELVGEQIFKGPRAGAASGVIVQPAQGYIFRVDIRSLSFVPVKMIPITKRTFTVEFAVDNELDLRLILDRVDKLKDIPGFVDLKTLES